MRLLLDTQIFYWSFYDKGERSPAALKIICEAEEIYVSSASMWEISIKIRLAKIKADPQELRGHIELAGFQELPVWSRHAVLVANLPLYHSDPFDRLLIAQAISEPLHLLTSGAQLGQHSTLVVQV